MLVDNAKVTEQLLQLYEAEHLNRPDIFQPEYVHKLNQAIVSLRLDITAMQGKAKLGQERHPDDQAGVIDALSSSNNHTDLAYIDFLTRWQKES